ncbi:MAG TPA: polysaccharide deacetylase family protein [Anaerolineaceae bacterium]|jgi:peptidoglycan/xylan/chitin deacetylase (PgdA/CDA1 family)|nr:polysaccharide deacetylase family protein [Anaerolineaceae bacterium]
MKKCLFSILNLAALAGLALTAPAPVLAAAQAQALPPASQSADPGRTQSFIQLVNNWTAPDQPADSAQDLPHANPDLVVYLTFDDGPDPDWTPQILALLQEYHATAVFYEIGRNARTYPQISLEVAEAGQMIGLHGYNHIELSKLGYNDFYLEVIDTRDAIQDALSSRPDLEGQLTPCLRPPYGAVNDAVYSYAYNMNYAISMWHLDTRDWTGISGEEILATVEKELVPYRVVLMHDGGEDRSETVRGLELVLHELTLRGYHFEPYCTATGQEYNH